MQTLRKDLWLCNMERTVPTAVSFQKANGRAKALQVVSLRAHAQNILDLASVFMLFLKVRSIFTVCL